MPFETLRDWLLGFVLTPAGAGAILYFILGQVPRVKDWFLGLDTKMKELVVMLLAFGIPLLGTAVAIGLTYLPFTEDVVFNALQIGFLAWGGNQAVRAIKKILA
jgi:hypothetical protein